MPARDQVHLPGDQPGLLVVGEEDVDPAELLEQGLPLRVDPEPDRVHGHQGRLAELAQDEVVVLRVEVGQVDDARAPVGAGTSGRKSAKTLSSVRTVVRRLGSSSYFPSQWKVLPGLDLEAREVDAARPEEGQGLARKVPADDADDARPGEVARRERAVGPRAADDPLPVAPGRPDGVEGDRTDDDETHGVPRT